MIFPFPYYFVFFLLGGLLVHGFFTVLQAFDTTRPYSELVRSGATFFHELLHFLMMKLLLVEVSFSDISFSEGSIEVPSTPRNSNRDSFLKQLLIVFSRSSGAPAESCGLGNSGRRLLMVPTKFLLWSGIFFAFW